MIHKHIKCGCGCGIGIITPNIYYKPVKYVWGHGRRGKHLTENHKQKISKANKGENNWNWGGTTSHKQKEAVRQAAKFKWEQMTPKEKQGWVSKISQSRRGCSPSLETRKKISLTLTGETVFLGFKARFRTRLVETSNYKNWRKEIFKRDNYTCRKCYISGCYLEAHHIKPLRIILKEYNINTIEKAKHCKELWNIDNGLTLCTNCHSILDIYRKRFLEE